MSWVDWAILEGLNCSPGSWECMYVEHNREPARVIVQALGCF
jgi:hypothetical protein